MSHTQDLIKHGNTEIAGTQSLPSTGFLVLPGWVDASSLNTILSQLKGRKITLVTDLAANHPAALQSIIDKGDSIGFNRAEPASKDFAAALQKATEGNHVAVYVPGPSKRQIGEPCAIPSENLRRILEVGVPTVPTSVEHNVMSQLAVETGAGDAEYSISFETLLQGTEVSVSGFREGLMRGSEATFSRRSLFNEHIGHVILRGLKANSSTKMIDGLDGSELDYGKLLAAAIVLSKYIKKQTSKDRVAIILPPGKGGFIANIAVLLAGKIPVNLNFTASVEAIKSSISQADIDKFITADKFVRKVSTFPWPPNRDLIYLERVLPDLKPKIILWAILGKILPTSALASLSGVPKEGGDKEAILLFTSGSSGDPKGVVLTHRNLLANVLQFGSRLAFSADDKVLASLPLFHSFGCTVTMCYPMIEGLSVVTYPSPLETQKIAELIHKHRVSLFLATPTFLRGYLRRVKKEHLAPLKLVVTGAEKLPAQLAAAFKKRFGKDVYEGYGLTETSPAANLNLPNLEASDSEDVIPSALAGSVGPPLPGIAYQIRDADSGETMPLCESGMIWVRGPNVFGGYLNQPEKTKEVIVDGWFCTGDIGRIDEEGFLHIEGRLSRFSKIAGEMVPHETVEDEVVKVMGLENDDERRIAIMSVPDEKKGEAIVVLSTVASDMYDQEVIDLRYKLIEIGIPSLWTPKRIIPTEEIPALASGKLDLKACKALVDQHMELLKKEGKA